MTSKICSSCKRVLTSHDMFCPDCGTKYVEPSDSTDPYKNFENKVIIETQKSNEVDKSIESSIDFDNQGFFSILLGTSEYSVARAKWFYRKAESIINMIVLIVLALSVLFLLITFVSSPVFGFVQLFTTAIAVGAMFIGLIFYKLFLMGIGSVIRIAELAEKSSKKE